MDYNQVEEDLADATMVGLTTMQYGSEDEADPMIFSPQERLQQKINEPLFEDDDKPVKVTAKMAAQGRKAMKEKLDKVTGQQKSEILHKIGLYYEHFPFLKETAPKKKYTVKDKIEVLSEELERCKSNLASANAFTELLQCEKVLGWFTGLALHTFGYSGQFENQFEELREFRMPELKELSIKYEDFFAHGPEFRYFFKYLRVIYLAIDLSKKNKTFNFQNQEAAEEMTDKYASL